MLCAALLSSPSFAQKTKAQLSTEIGTTFPDNTAGQITPAGVRAFQNDVINSIMPNAPVVSGNLACFNGTTGLLQDCGVAPNTLTITTSNLANGSVTYSKLQNESASTLLGNPTGVLASPSEITLDPTLSFSGTTLKCTTFGSAQAGCVPGSGGGTTNFLRADGNWATPAGAGNVSGPGSSTSGDLVTFSGTTGTIVQDQTAISTNQPITLGGQVNLNGTNFINGDGIFGSGKPWFDVKSAQHGCAAAAGDNSTDDTTAIQCHIDYMHNTFGGGTVYFPPGNYLVSGGGVVVRGGIWLLASSIDSTSIQVHTDSIAVQFYTSSGTCPGGGLNGGIDKFSVYGYQNAATTQPAIFIGDNCVAHILNSRVWFGTFGLKNNGTDGLVFNSFICGYVGCVQSSGANWYVRTKLDAVSPGTIPTTYGFVQGANVPGLTIAENHFLQTDLSVQGATYSLYIDDGANTSITHFDGSVFDSPIFINHAKWVQITGSEVGSTSFTINAGTLMMTGTGAFGATTVSGAGAKACAANANFTNC